MSSILLLLDGSKNLTTWIFATHAMIITFNNISNPKILRYQPSNQDYWSCCPNLVVDCCFYIAIRTMHLWSYFCSIEIITTRVLMEPSKAIQILLLLDKVSAYQKRVAATVTSCPIIFLMYSSWLSLKALYFVLIISSMENWPNA